MGKALRITLVLALGALLAAGLAFCCADRATAPGITFDSGVAGSAAASTSSTVSRVTITLPAPRSAGPLSLEQAIGQRRSVREYSATPLSMEELSQLLWAAQGITSPAGGRAAPSAGGTYPLELYVVAGMVTDLGSGVYHYLPEEHTLTMTKSGDLRAELAEACLSQEWVASAPADVVVAAVYERTTERYGERGVRYVHLEAGHAAQNLCLQATALGLGAVTVGAFSDDQVATLLPLGEGETPLYVIPVGHRR